MVKKITGKILRKVRQAREERRRKRVKKIIYAEGKVSTAPYLIVGISKEEMD